MNSGQVVLALLFASSFDTNDVKQNKELVCVEQSNPVSGVLKFEYKKVSTIKARRLIDPFKAGYIQEDEKEEQEKLELKRLKFIKPRRCHNDVNFYGKNNKVFGNKNNLRACGRK